MSGETIDIAGFTARFEPRFERFFADAALSGPHTAPERLVKAMRYGALNGGKRLRPMLVVETAGGAVPAADPRRRPARRVLSRRVPCA